MSMQDSFRIAALENKLKALEERVKALEPPEEGAEIVAYPVVHIGHGKYAVNTIDGTRVTDVPMTREEAESVAADLTEQLARMVG